MTKNYTVVLTTIGLVLSIIWFARPTLIADPLQSPAPVVCIDDIQCVAIDYGISEVQLRETLRCESGLKHEGIFGDGGEPLYGRDMG